jgi:uracil DNA glycosylase
MQSRTQPKEGWIPNGLANSYHTPINPTTTPPPIAVTMRQQYLNAYGLAGPRRYDNEHWAKEGVLMINACLTCPDNLTYKKSYWLGYENEWWYLTYQTMFALN